MEGPFRNNILPFTEFEFKKFSKYFIEKTVQCNSVISLESSILGMNRLYLFLKHEDNTNQKDKIYTIFQYLKSCHSHYKIPLIVIWRTLREIKHEGKFENIINYFLIREHNYDIDVMNKMFKPFDFDPENEDDQKLFETITNFGILDGELIVYAITDFFPLEEVKIINITIFQHYGNEYDIRDYIVDLFKLRYSDVIVEGKYGNTTIKSEKHIPIIIRFTYGHIGQHIQYKNDYARCCFYRGKFLIADEARIAHDTKVITSKNNYSKEKLDSLYKMGFVMLDGIPKCLARRKDMLSERYTKFNDSLMCLVYLFGGSSEFLNTVDLFRFNMYYTNIILQYDLTGIKELNLLITEFCNGRDCHYFTEWYDNVDFKRLSEFCTCMNSFNERYGEEALPKKTLDYRILDYMSAFPELFRIPNFFGKWLREEIECCCDYYHEDLTYYFNCIFG